MTDLLHNSQAMQTAEDNISFDDMLIPPRKSTKKEKTIVDMSLSRIRRFTDSDGKEQPYRIDEEELEQLILSIEDEGLLHPILLRETEDGTYQILSGHKRVVAFQRLGRSVIPSIVVNELTDNEAYMMMAEANIQRKNTKPSEIGKIITKYLDMKKNEEKITVDKVCKKFNISKKSYYRYIYLVELVPDLQKLCDEERFSTNAVEETKLLTEHQQRVVADFIRSYNVKTYLEKHAKAVTELAQEKQDFSKEDLYILFTAPRVNDTEKKEDEKEDKSSRTMIYYHLSKAFPEEFNSKNSTEMDDIILKAVKFYFENN